MVAMMEAKKEETKEGPEVKVEAVEMAMEAVSHNTNHLAENICKDSDY